MPGNQNNSTDPTPILETMWGQYLREPALPMSRVNFSAWERQMVAYMSSMERTPPSFLMAGDPVDRYQTPTEMEAARLQVARLEQVEQVEIPVEHIQNPAFSTLRADAVPGPIEYQISWDPELTQSLKKKDKPVIPEAKKMNDLSYRIYHELKECVELFRGSNAWMAYSRIVEERLIAKGPFVSNSCSGNISYLTSKGRTESMKLGRFIRRHVLKENVLPEKVFQKCVEGLVNHFFPKCEFHVDSGKQITLNYENCVGGSSCMSGGDADKVAMYADNPKCFSQLIGKQNRTTARAIIFHMDDGYKLLGRIYCGSAYLTDMMEKYAKDKGWMIRSELGLEIKGEVIEDHSKYELRISGVKWKEGGVPYMDDFEHADVDDEGTLTLYYNCGGKYNLSNVSGFLINGCTCCQCEESFSVDDCYSTDEGYYCEGCHEDTFAPCDNCGKTVRMENIHSICGGAVCEDCIGNYIECVHCSEFHGFDDITHVGIDGEVVCKDCLEGQYIICGECGEYVSTDCITTVDEQELCEECKETVEC